MVPYKEWSGEVTEYVDDGKKEKEHALLPLFHFVVGDLPANTVAPELGDSNAGAALKLCQKEISEKGKPLSANVIDIPTIGIYLAYLVALCFMPAPTEKGRRELPSLDQSRVQALAHGQLRGRSARS